MLMNYEYEKEMENRKQGMEEKKNEKQKEEAWWMSCQINVSKAESFVVLSVKYFFYLLKSVKGWI